MGLLGRSDRSLAVPTPRGASAGLRVPYKVTTPLRKVKAVRPSENKHRPEQKYVHLASNDGFVFWWLRPCPGRAGSELARPGPLSLLRRPVPVAV